MPDPFGELLKRQRHDHNLTLRGVADELGVSVADVSAWENGRLRPVNGDEYLRAMEAYRVPGELCVAAADLWRMPVLEFSRDLAFSGAHVSWAHDDSLGDACGCNDCRAAWFNAHACQTCGGDGLQPGCGEKPDDPREVARLERQSASDLEGQP